MHACPVNQDLLKWGERQTHIERESKYTAVLPGSSVGACCFFLVAEGLAMHMCVCVCVCCQLDTVVLAGFHVYCKLSPCLFECASRFCSFSWWRVYGRKEQGGPLWLPTGAEELPLHLFDCVSGCVYQRVLFTKLDDRRKRDDLGKTIKQSHIFLQKTQKCMFPPLLVPTSTFKYHYNEVKQTKQYDEFYSKYTFTIILLNNIALCLQQSLSTQ